MNNFDLSVVIPAYNCKRFLIDSVSSALDCNPASIFIHDDHSSDGTKKLAEELVAAYPERITLASNPRNIGMTRNWQLAMSDVQTPFCLKLDADDWIDPGYVCKAMTLLRDNSDIGILGGNAMTIAEDDRRSTWLQGHQPRIDINDNHTFKLRSGLEAARAAIVWEPFPYSFSTIFRMTAWRDAGGFDTDLKWCSDREIWFRIALSYTTAYWSGLSGAYRVHCNSVSASLAECDHFVIDLDKMFRRAKACWPQRELKALFKKQFRLVSKAYFGSSIRSAMSGKITDSFNRFRCGIGLLPYCV